MHRRRENLARDRSKKIRRTATWYTLRETSRHECIQGINANNYVKGGHALPTPIHPPGEYQYVNHGWINLIRLVAQDILNIRNCPGRFQHLGPSREDGDTLLRRIEHRLYTWQDASNVRCDERIIRVQHRGGTL